MNNFSVLFQKEWRENVRNFKIIWIPLVFIVFGIMEPVSNYYLPQILNSVGNLPEGTVFEMPTLTAEQILMSTVSQYQFIGMLVVTLAFVGIISRERKNGTATMLYVRPISFTSYIASKLAIMALIVMGSFLLGMLASLYYVTILFGKVGGAEFLGFIGTYCMWLLFVISIVILSSSAFTSGIASMISLLFVIFGQLIDALLGAYWTITPWKLPYYAGYILSGSVDESTYLWTMLLTLLLSILCLFGAVYFAKINSAKAKI